VETLACDARKFRIRGELVSVIYGLFRCENGDLFTEFKEYRTKESSMTDFQLEAFHKMKESKTHFKCCNGGQGGILTHYYDGECQWCDEGNKEKSCLN